MSNQSFLSEGRRVAALNSKAQEASPLVKLFSAHTVDHLVNIVAEVMIVDAFVRVISCTLFTDFCNSQYFW